MYNLVASPSRRRLLQLLACTPLLNCGSLLAAPSVAERIVALEWRPVELLLALGVMPLAVADLPNYRRWVVEPQLAPTVQDVGLRSEPSLELLQRLKPSLILLSSGFGPNAARIAPLAPQWVSQFSRAPHGPLATTEQDLRALGGLLGREAAAETWLDGMSHRFAEAAQRLHRFREEPLLLFSFLDSRRVMVFGRGSLFADVLARLGLVNAWQGETNAWGSAIIGIEQLAQVEGVRALCFLHGDDDPMREIARAQLWRSIPFVRDNKLHLLPAVWFFGANYSALRFSQLLTLTLEEAA
ncbi:Fe(3+)-hydroxamate ABC transporter substrate-binding protein FhuD [Erwinia sp. Leaf53]|uniref:Fe(3+)-hydroxamate ABC transporter substrate-binding protein FhuD n=1 Tax=Erwinia sp. Leaf53 TaxID=1736225 RepID=UPI0006F9A202|nr:Fe(3+)-hydroxamate ABC transporter substrate-binding protein FhuD [Erwinia sp. Leaf53]KQN56704.1 iron-hydroxamate transporter substrate-binding subunit [Erwinia sp. Leaf53]